jgi:hypothetical protein
MPLKSDLRTLLYKTEKRVQRARFGSLPEPQEGWPIVLGISFPKSGTHLLDQILLGFSKFAPFSTRLHSFFAGFEGDTGRKHTTAETLAWLASLHPCDITSAHLFALPEVLEQVCKPAFLSYFIFRDPRDVAVSHVFYVTEMETNHVHHAYYQALPDFDARLRISILGRPEAGVEFPDIAGRFSPYLGWLDQAPVMKIHFEDLVNERTRILNLVLDHLLRRIGDASIEVPRARILEILDSSINPSRSPTFRSGKTGEWRKFFKDEHKRIFKEVAGDLLVRLGYEENNEW